jgi:hypothetical protein
MALAVDFAQLIPVKPVPKAEEDTLKRLLLKAVPICEAPRSMTMSPVTSLIIELIMDMVYKAYFFALF